MNVKKRPSGSFIDHEKELIFIHIPKTSGTSIVSAIKATTKHKIETFGHRPIWFPIFQPYTGRYKSFAITRHPFERFLSGYNWVKKTKLTKDLAISYFELISFSLNNNINEFIDFLYNNKQFWNGTTPPSSFIPQYYWVTSIGDDSDISVHEVIDFNNRDRIYKILDEYYPEANCKNVHMLKADCNKLDQYNSLTKESKSKLYRLYEKDFNLFNYEK